MKEKSKGFAQVVSDRLKLFVNAFCAGDNTSALALVSQAKCLENTGNKLLRSIELKKVSDCFPMHRLQLNWLKFGSINHMELFLRPSPYIWNSSKPFIAWIVPTLTWLKEEEKKKCYPR